MYTNMIYYRELDVKLMTTGRLKGQAFVTFTNIQRAQQAVNEANGYVLYDRPLVIVRYNINTDKFGTNIFILWITGIWSQERMSESNILKATRIKYPFGGLITYSLHTNGIYLTRIIRCCTDQYSKLREQPRNFA